MAKRRKNTKEFICIRCSRRTTRNIPSNTEWTCFHCEGLLKPYIESLFVKQDIKAKEDLKGMGL